jgi:hypothetical protein
MLLIGADNPMLGKLFNAQVLRDLADALEGQSDDDAVSRSALG